MSYEILSRATTAALAMTMVSTLALSGAALAQEEPAAEPVQVPAPIQAIDFKPFNKDLKQIKAKRMAKLDELVLEASFADLQAAMDAGKLTSEELTLYYLARNKTHRDLNSMLELNPAALNQARKSDKRRAAGELRGPLDGIPITLKGNIGTKDKMATSAGAVALADNISDEDSAVAAGLRKAGAVLLGKANLSEWAGWIYPPAPGFSALGGYPINPYDPALPVYGSSSGSGVGVAANLTAASVGTETSGSLIAPASANMTVGMHPSLGVVSRHRVVPLTSQTDTPGPVAKNVTDAAALLTAIAGPDDNDPVTQNAAALGGTDYTTFLDEEALEGIRVGVYLPVPQPDEAVGDEELMQAYLAFGGPGIPALTEAGAELAPIFGGGPVATPDQFIPMINNGFRIEFAEYIAQVDPDGPITSLADVVAFNEEDAGMRAPFGEGYLADAAESTLSQEDYDALAEQLRTEARAYIDGLMEADDLDIIASRANYFAPAYPLAGYPAITVPDGPLGEDGPLGQLYGLTLVGPYLSDGELIGYAYAYEQASQARTAPPIDDQAAAAEAAPAEATTDEAAAEDSGPPEQGLFDFSLIDTATLPVTVPFEWVLSHINVDVALGPDGEPGSFMFDTGAPTTITNPAAEMYGGEVLAETQSEAGGDQVLVNRTMRLDTLAVGDLRIDNLLVQDGWNEPPNALQCVTEHGLFGAASMHNGVWQIDYANENITIAESVDDLDHIDGAMAIPFTTTGGTSPTPYVQLPVADGEVVFIVDTGFGGTIALNPDAAEAAGVVVPEDAPALQYVGIGAAGPFEASQQLVNVPITFGEEPIVYPVTIGPGLAPGVGGNIGTLFLQDFVTTFDWDVVNNAGVMYLDPIAEDGSFTPPAAPPNASVQWSGDTTVVGSVAKGGPAYEAGLVPNTPVTSIDGVDTAGMTLDDFCQIAEGQQSFTTEDGQTYETTRLEGFYDSLSE